MPSRTSSKKVTFRRPFRLSGFDSPQPAGTYRVDTQEELLQALSFAAWRRVATTMPLTHNGVTEFMPVDPSELDSALARDAAPDDSITSDPPRRPLYAGTGQAR